MTTVRVAHHWSGGRLLRDAGAVLRAEDGTHLRPPVERWLGPVTTEEWHVLERAVGPALDVGCGPGRHVVGLLARHVAALGIDVAEGPLAVARRRGAPVLNRSVFDPLPGEGSWATVLLLDGSIGIGGDPIRLLRRTGELLRDDGRVLVEVEAPGAGVHRTRLCVHGDRRGAGDDPPAWFPWARVAADALEQVASDAGLREVEHWEEAGRWFTELAMP